MGAPKIIIETSQEEFLKRYLESLNGIFNLTDKQLTCLYHMIMINKSITGTTEIRKILVDKLKIKDVLALNNLIKPLKDKGAIIENRNDKNYTYHEALVPKALSVEIKFKIV